jgi:hypothetical protein
MLPLVATISTPAVALIAFTDTVPLLTKLKTPLLALPPSVDTWFDPVKLTLNPLAWSEPVIMPVIMEAAVWLIAPAAVNITLGPLRLPLKLRDPPLAIEMLPLTLIGAETVTASVSPLPATTLKPAVTLDIGQIMFTPGKLQPAAMPPESITIIYAPLSLKMKFVPSLEISRLPEVAPTSVNVSTPPVTFTVAVPVAACKPAAASATTAASRQAATRARDPRWRAGETRSHRAGLPASYREKSENGAGARRPRVSHETKRGEPAVKGLIVDRLYTDSRP